MRAFGLDLAKSAAEALQESFVKAHPLPDPGGDRGRDLLRPAAPDHRPQQEQPAVNDSPAAAQQQMIMKIFPIFSGMFSFIVPAALAWYFLVQNLFRIGQQAYITKRFYREHPDAIAPSRPAAKAAQHAKAPKAHGQRDRQERRSQRGGKATTAPPAKARRRRPSRRRAPSEQRQAPDGPEAARRGPRGARRSRRLGPAPSRRRSPDRDRSEEASPMEWVETTGRTTEEAKERRPGPAWAWTRADAEFEILEEPRPGLFGRIRGEARVRARVRPDRTASRRSSAATAGIGAARTSPAPTATTASPAARRGPTGRAEAAARRQRHRARPDAEPSASENPIETPASEDDATASRADSEQVAEDATEFVVGLLDAFGLEATSRERSPRTARSRCRGVARASGCWSDRRVRRCWPSRI